MTSITYQSAGVDIRAGNEAVSRIKRAVESTFSASVLTKLGSFGALFDLGPIIKTYEHPVLVQSIDGVGTKMMVATKMQKFDTIGIDLVSATANDIIVLGARPLTLLDYIANDRLKVDIIESIISGMVKACNENDIALVGGEMAEMPGTYQQGEHDVVGVITGVCEKNQAILGENIEAGDLVLAFASSGLHTNGYSLARKLIFEIGGLAVDAYLPALKQSIGETLLTPHLNYTKPVLYLLAEGVSIKGMAHITGGGVIENIPRILPQGLAVEINKLHCPIPPIFPLLQSLGHLEEKEMYRTFNMGMGFVMIMAEKDKELAEKLLLKKFATYPLYHIGRVVKGETTVRLI